MQQLFTNCGVKTYALIVKFFALLLLPGFLSLAVNAQNYTPNTFADPVITSVNNTTGALNGGSTISLRSALLAADNLGGTHIITLGTGTYLLDGSASYTVPSQGTFSSRTIFFGNSSQDITINGNGLANTNIKMAATGRDRIFAINYDGTTPGVFTTINGVKFSDGYLNYDTYGGGAIYAGPYGVTETLTISNCAFDNNICPSVGGSGGLGGAIYMFQGTLNIANSSFTNNKSIDGDGGAIIYLLFNQGDNGVINISNSTFSGNQAGANGGAISFIAQGSPTPGQTFSASIRENTFVNNAAAGFGGAIAANNATATSVALVNYNRFVGNTSTASSSTSGLLYANSDGSVNAENNWWGCNTGPTAAGTCDKAGAVGSGGSGTLVDGKWLQIKATASPSSICTAAPNNTSTVTASFLSNSANEAIAVSDLDALIGLPISFVNPTLGTLSGAQTTIQSSGTATVTFTSNGTGGNGSVNAVVDNVPNNDAVAKASITINAGPTISTQPANTTVCAGATAQFTVSASGTAPLTYQWYRGATALANGPSGTGSTYSGATTNTLTITNTSTADNGNDYNVVISNSCGTVTSASRSLTVISITVTNPANSTGTQGVPFSETFTQSGGTLPVTFSTASALPPGLSLSSGGVLSGTPTASGSYNIIVTVTDANGCVGTGANYNLVISCPTPITSCPGNTTVSNDPGVCNAVVNYTVGVSSSPPPTVTYVFSGATTGSGSGTGSGSTFNKGTTTVTVTVTNSCATGTCTFDITVNDTENPTASNPAPVNVQCVSAVPAPNTAVVTDEADNCIFTSVTFVSDVNNGGSGCPGNPYIVTRTYRVTDGSGNFINVVQTITALDNTAPVISCPAPVTVQCASAVPAHDFAGGSASDNCGSATVTWISDVISNQTCTNKYTITRTYQAADACGNTTTCTQTITVNDNTAPTISCPAPVTVQCASAVPAHDFAGGSASDNCGSVTVTWLSDVISNQTCANKFTITRTYQAADACGNTTTCTQTITVNDNTAPIITCPAAVTVQCASAVPAHDFAGGSASDNCGSATVTWISDVISNQTCANKYTITRTYQAADACGNTTTCTQTITVNDNTAPTITCPAAVTVQCASAVPAHDFAGGSASDNCGSVTVTWISDVISNQTCANKFTLTRTYTATDACGNTSSCTQVITVNDNVDPTISCPASQTVPPTSLAGAVVTYTEPVGTDNCSGATTTRTAGPASGSTFPIGTTTVTYQVTDACGNTASCSFTVTVTDPYCTADHRKVYVCHHGHTICVSVNALPAHLGHGDSFGPCATSRMSFVDNTEAEDDDIKTVEPVKKEVRETEQANDKFAVVAYPNPSTTDFSILVNSSSNEPVTVRIMDMNGVIKAVVTKVAKGNIIRVGADLKGGTYMAEIRQGSNKQMIKLVKVN